MIPFEQIFYSVLSLLPAAVVSGLGISLQTLGRIQGREELQDSTRFPLFKLLSGLQPKNIWSSVLFALSLSKFTYYLIFGFVSFYFIFFFDEASGKKALLETSHHLSFYSSSILEIVLVVLLSLTLEILLSLVITRAPTIAVRLLSFPSALLMVPLFPLMFIYLQCLKLFQKPFTPPNKPPFKLKDKLFDYFSESELDRYLKVSEKKLIRTVISFEDRIVREVMVPRINICSLPADTSIFEAARRFAEEGYSRIPVYKDNVDKTIGVLLYKDIISIYTEHLEKGSAPKSLQMPIEKFVKPILYTPETKKISRLLQEFRLQQIHIAIVVDEYGGTEGIVTIEDILEELVGEIEDEYDTQEERHFQALSPGEWLVDAQMSILDIEQELGIQIPNHAEYDTLGGYIFHKAGSIPSKGWKIHLDDVDLEVLKSDERSIHKIKITQNHPKK